MFEVLIRSLILSENMQISYHNGARLDLHVYPLLFTMRGNESKDYIDPNWITMEPYKHMLLLLPGARMEHHHYQITPQFTAALCDTRQVDKYF